MAKKKFKPTLHNSIATNEKKSGTSALVCGDTNEEWKIKIVLILLTFAVFFPALNNGFVNWDDHTYITENELIKNSSFSNLVHIFTPGTIVFANFHPLTIFTYIIEYKFFGLNPFPYHFTNMIVHIVNVLLVFQLVRAISKKKTTGWITAVLFAVHPMRVESVAWVSERKDVLYTCFFLLSLIIYLKYLNTAFQNSKPPRFKYLFFSFGFFILSGCSKSGAVVLPVVLLLFDYYFGRKINKILIFEKLPFFIISIALGIWALKAQHTSLTSIRLEQFSAVERVLFASYGIVGYLYKLVLPVNLSCYYPYPVKVGGTIPFLFYFSPVVIFLIVFFVIFSLRFTKKIFFGFLFFFITIVLVLQLLPIGDAIMADRYSYLPYFGLFFVIGEGIVYLKEERLKSFKNSEIWIRMILIIILILFSVRSFQQCKVWKNSETLWTNVIDKLGGVAYAYNNRGSYYDKEGQSEKAFMDYDRAVKLKPDYFTALSNRGNYYASKNQFNLALTDYNSALVYNSVFQDALFNRGLLYQITGKYDLAINDFEELIRLNPDNYYAWCSKGFAMEKMGDKAKAIEDYSRAIRLNPSYILAYNNRANDYFNLNDFNASIRDYNTLLQLVPSQGETWMNRSAVYYKMGNFKSALSDALKAKSLGYPVDERYLKLLKN